MEISFVGEPRWPGLLLVSTDLESLRMPVDQEPGHAFRCLGIEAELGRDAAVGDPHLCARQSVIFVNRAVRRRAHLADVMERAFLAVVDIVTAALVARVIVSVVLYELQPAVGRFVGHAVFSENDLVRIDQVPQVFSRRRARRNIGRRRARVKRGSGQHWPSSLRRLNPNRPWAPSRQRRSRRRGPERGGTACGTVRGGGARRGPPLHRA